MHCYKQKEGWGMGGRNLLSIDLDAASVEKLTKIEHAEKENDNSSGTAQQSKKQMDSD